MAINWSKIKHFRPYEFSDPDYPGSYDYIMPGTVKLLNELREETGWPIITHWASRGCVCVNPTGHSERSTHYINSPLECSAVDWHFDTDVYTRHQAMKVLRSGFTGIGIYYDWQSCKVGFHTDMRLKPQVWTRDDGEYRYWLQ